ncbi:MAG: hypothetical protein EOM46_20620, partial [Gammaproteobacteria bacterium]|nr:hypothetical protein [Gammaproteobacteria bacterium]
MKKSLTLLSSVLLTSAVLIAPAFAAVDVEDAMKDMSKSYRLVMNADDAASLKKDLATFRAAAVEAQSGIPDKMKKQPAAEIALQKIDNQCFNISTVRKDTKAERQLR